MIKPNQECEIDDPEIEVATLTDETDKKGDGPQERPRRAKLLKVRHAKFNPKNVIFSDEKQI